jgi:hypothetical protein
VGLKVKIGGFAAANLRHTFELGNGPAEQGRDFFAAPKIIFGEVRAIGLFSKLYLGQMRDVPDLCFPNASGHLFLFF